MRKVPPLNDAEIDVITPLEELFVYHIMGIPGEARQWEQSPDSYTLAVTGLVDRELQLTLADLRDSFEPVRVPLILQCTTNIHWGRIEITGARLGDVLNSAGLQEGALKVALRAADGFDTDLKLDYIRETDPPVLVAYGMNGQDVPLEHGFVARIAAPGKYGFKWIKWLTEIEVVDYDFKGHYEGRRGWSDDGQRGQRIL